MKNITSFAEFINENKDLSDISILYHGSKKSHLDSIIKNGLLVSKKKSNDGKRYIYSTNNKNFAKIFGDVYSPSGKNNNGIIVVFEAPKNLKIDEEVENYRKNYPDTKTLRDNLDRYSLEVRIHHLINFENKTEEEADRIVRNEILKEKWLLRKCFEEGAIGIKHGKITPDKIIQIEDFNGNILYNR